MVLNGADKRGGFEQRFVGSSVELGVATTEDLDMRIGGG
jgi:hypothetical protein